MAKLRHHISGTVCYHDVDKQRRDDHDQPQRFPKKAPAYIFKKPETMCGFSILRYFREKVNCDMVVLK
ncbi:hypothetical protein [Mucilaginibacter sp. 10B2]|uniref:hypothetical protein n=1 Tax=Mucilaginibacter sp. 10B2 TaxID=3048574 RepID=UPI002B22AB25|nr:hypothetical protein [Mucilaginibacter sp. 10B2]MEB0279519.1 hypothetical protein [Mucilaginibacter sp. 10B2]